MNADKGEEGAVISGLNSNLKRTAWFCSGSELVTNGFLDRKAGKNGQSILPPLEIHERSETMMHSQKISEDCSLVDVSGASASVVNFLKSYQIRLELAQDGRDSPQVHLIVHAAAMLYVVSNQSELNRLRCLDIRPAHETGRGEEK
tara:strand:+ start:8829 stop:9266 length:438 start_codon:yes stop_codon:yes gene_type:complete